MKATFGKFMCEGGCPNTGVNEKSYFNITETGKKLYYRLRVGEKYIMLADNVRPIAILVDAIVIQSDDKNNLIVTYIVKRADGKVQNITLYANGSNNDKLFFFPTKDDYMQYIRKEKTTYLRPVFTITDLIFEYIDNLNLVYWAGPVNQHLNHPTYVTPVAFVTRNGEIARVPVMFKTFWIDTDGVHYETLDHYSVCGKTYDLFETKEKAFDSLCNIVEFTDSIETEKEQTISDRIEKILDDEFKGDVDAFCKAIDCSAFSMGLFLSHNGSEIPIGIIMNISKVTGYSINYIAKGK